MSGRFWIIGSSYSVKIDLGALVYAKHYMQYVKLGGG